MFGHHVDIYKPANLVLQPQRLSVKTHNSFSSALLNTPKAVLDFKNMKPDSVLTNIPLFNPLSSEEMRTVSSYMERVEYSKGKEIFRQGEAGDAFYIILNGECNVYRSDDIVIEVNQSVVLKKAINFGANHVPKGSTATVDKVDMTREYPYTIRIKQTGVRGRVASGEIVSSEQQPAPVLVASIKAGDFFGEQALVHGKPRGATVTASTDVIVLRLRRERFLQNRLDTKLMFPRRKAILPNQDEYDSFSKYENLPRPSSKDITDIKRAIKKNDKLSVLHWSEETLTSIAQAARLQTVEKNQVVIRRGEINADLFYVVQSGEFVFSSAQIDILLDKLAHLGKAEAGSSFGEMALIHNAPRAATVICTWPGKLWVISRKHLKAIFENENEARIKQYTNILQNVKLLQPLTHQERHAVSQCIVEINSLKGEDIIKQGEVGDAFFILVSGTVDVRKDNEVVSTLTAEPQKNKSHWFGERALLENEPRAATIRVRSDDAYVLALKRIDFERLLGPLEDILREAASNNRSVKLGLHYDETTRCMEALPAAKDKDPSYASMQLEDLEKKAVLGVGGFGAVHMVQHRKTKKVYALKALSKGYILKMKMQKSVMREKEILSLCDSAFIVKMYRTFKNHDTLFFLLEVFLGGELYHLYHRKRFHGSVSKARFYTAAVTCAFEYLHNHHVLYRDLKPENLLLDGQGLCKLTDMGLAKIVTGKTYTTCGTPDYFSPEVIQQTGQTKGVDWWTLGILIHEFLSGHAPFSAESPMATYKKVILGIGRIEIKYSTNDPHGASLVISLLKHNAGDRLPMRTGGLSNLFDHPWFRSFDWAAFRRGHLPPPYVPKVTDPTDSSNFQTSKTDAKVQTAYTDPKTGWDDAF